MFIIKKQKNKKGVSFYELVISLFLINLVLFSVLSVITMLLRGSMHVNENSKGAVVANSIMNLYMSGDIQSKKTDSSETPAETEEDTINKVVTNKVAEMEFAGIKYYYLIEETVAKQSETGKPGLNNIKLRVSLNEKFKTNTQAYLEKPDDQDITIVTLKVCDKTEAGLPEYKDDSTGGSSTGGTTSNTTNPSSDPIVQAEAGELPTGYNPIENPQPLGGGGISASATK